MENCFIMRKSTFKIDEREVKIRESQLYPIKLNVNICNVNANRRCNVNRHWKETRKKGTKKITIKDLMKWRLRFFINHKIFKISVSLWAERDLSISQMMSTWYRRKIWKPIVQGMSESSCEMLQALNWIRLRRIRNGSSGRG